MFQIKNNRVYITRGQDAVYTASVRRDDKYNSPYIISIGINNPKIRMTIKANKNDKNSLLDYEGFIGSDIHRFDSQVIIDISQYPTNNIVNQLYRLKTYDQYNRPSYSYHYYDGDITEAYDVQNWKLYDLIIRIPIESSDTMSLSSGTYYYDMALIERDSHNDIEFSDTWITPTEFIIGGSFGE